MTRVFPLRSPMAWAALLAFLPGALPGQQTAAAAAPGQTAAAPVQATAPFPGGDPQAPWLAQGQMTWIDQAHPSFPSPYEGPNSFQGASQAERTFSFSLFLGYRVLAGTELYFDPEFFQGHGLSNTLGMAGYPNGEAVKAAFPNLHYNTSRLYLRQTFGLGGETEKVEGGQQQVGTSYYVNRVTLTVGKLAASDLFDDNEYSHDARSQFMNWALWESAAWDYPADIVGYTAGFAAEWNTKDWELHYGMFMEPTEPNGADLDKHLLDAHGQILQFDRRYSFGALSGTVRPFVYWNQARMGSYADAVALPSIDTALTQTRAYRSKVGLGVSWDQEVTSDLGVFFEAQLGRRTDGVLRVHRGRPLSRRRPQPEGNPVVPQGRRPRARRRRQRHRAQPPGLPRSRRHRGPDPRRRRPQLRPRGDPGGLLQPRGAEMAFDFTRFPICVASRIQPRPRPGASLCLASPRGILAEGQPGYERRGTR